MIVGNDISHWQGLVDFDTYKQNSNFVILKATEGLSGIDIKFQFNQAEARRVGLPVGFYHFARPDQGNTPQQEARAFLTEVGKLRNGEVLCLDYEPNWSGDHVAWCKGFLDEVFSLTGVKPFIYLSKSQVKASNWKSVVDGGYALWLASYSGTFETGAWGSVAMNQWTSSQQVPGIAGNVDGDRFFGTVEQFKAYGYVSPPSPSMSPSSSPSPSISPSLSISPSPSQSPSVSPSPSPSQEIPPIDPSTQLAQLTAVIVSQWYWFGKNGWYNRLAQLRKIVNG